MANGFHIVTSSGDKIRFNYYDQDAPQTVKAFRHALPFSKVFFHARISGHEIWTDEGPSLSIAQENASVFCQPGEVVIGPSIPARVKTAGLMGIYYGEGKGLDAANIFACVFEEDKDALARLGNQIWRSGEQILTFETL